MCDDLHERCSLRSGILSLPSCRLSICHASWQVFTMVQATCFGINTVSPCLIKSLSVVHGKISGGNFRVCLNWCLSSSQRNPRNTKCSEARRLSLTRLSVLASSFCMKSLYRPKFLPLVSNLWTCGNSTPNNPKSLRTSKAANPLPDRKSFFAFCPEPVGRYGMQIFAQALYGGHFTGRHL